ncbi:hypothetical protein QE152_g13150 [Popillia japonica]|uniref:Endonuclease/exonuclease/phosphatase domain-containing protein n=1 Tax=Popillia japonica TaxID=7064 RepID=A0AAW1LAP1_POPJA
MPSQQRQWQHTERVNQNNSLLSNTAGPTHIPRNGNTPSTIDLVLARNVPHVDDMETGDLSSDHLPVLFTIGDVRRRSIGTIANDYGKANWQRFREEVSRGWAMRARIRDRSGPGDAVAAMQRKIQETLKVIVPTKRIDPFRSSELPQHVLEETKERNRLRRRYQRTREAETRVAMSEMSKRIIVD